MMSSPFSLIITTIGDAHGDIEGRIIFADNNPLIRSPNIPEMWVQPAVHAIGFAPTTSISHTAPRADGGKTSTFLINRILLFHINCRNLPCSSVDGTSEFLTWTSSIVISVDDVATSDSTARRVRHLPQKIIFFMIIH